MPEPIVLLPVPPAPDRLDSWKDIAAFFGREVRTVQGWEKNEGLPVHRHRHARQGSVYAFKSELEAWRKQRASPPEAGTVPATEPRSAACRTCALWLAHRPSSLKEKRTTSARLAAS